MCLFKGPIVGRENSNRRQWQLPTHANISQEDLQRGRNDDEPQGAQARARFKFGHHQVVFFKFSNLNLFISFDRIKYSFFYFY